MANFNQSPLGQASLPTGGNPVDLVVGATTLNVAMTMTSFETFGSSGSLDLATQQLAATGLFPSWRRPVRTVASS